MEIRPYTPWSALTYASWAQNAGSIFSAAKAQGLQGVWLCALAHLSVETADFSRFVGPWNYGNIKYTGHWKPAGLAYAVRYNDDNPNDLFMAFNAPQNGLAAYFKLIQNDRYGITGTETVQEYAAKLNAGGYATSPTFESAVVAKYKQILAKHPDLATWNGSGSPASDSSFAGVGWVAGIVLLLMVFGKKMN